MWIRLEAHSDHSIGMGPTDVLLHVTHPSEVYSENIAKKPHEIWSLDDFLDEKWHFVKVPKSNQNPKNSKKTEKIKNVKMFNKSN